MIGWFMHRGVRKFADHYDYDASYMHEVIDVSTVAAQAMMGMTKMSQFRGPRAARDVWVGSMLASTLEGDCGPCAQLVVDMALEAGVDASDLQACIEGRAPQGSDLELGYKFAQASISGDLIADELRGEIKAKYGDEAVVSAAFSAAIGRSYPVLKRGLGHGLACTRLKVGDADVAIGVAT